MPLSRRDFLKSSLAAAAVALGVFALKSPRQDVADASSGQAAPPPSTGRQEFAYRGRRVVIQETTGSAAPAIDVTINGVRQHVGKKTPPKGPPFYITHLLPFENFSNPVEMVKAMIDGEADMGLFTLG